MTNAQVIAYWRVHARMYRYQGGARMALVADAALKRYASALLTSSVGVATQRAMALAGEL